MHISQNPDTRTKLRNSLEVEHYRKQLTTVGILFLIFGTIMYFQQLSVGILFTLVMAPFLIYYGYRLIRIFRRADRYIFCSVTLSQPHYNYLTKAYFFTVIVDAPKIGRLVRQTRPIFATQSIVPPLMEDYVNQTVTVAYNPVSDTLVVIG